MKGATYAAILAGGYLLASAVWILVSGLLVNSGWLHAHVAADVVFVAVTGVAIYAAARHALGRISEGAAELARREHAILLNERRVFTGIIASTVAHDANNVLAVVLSELEQLEGPLDVDTAQRMKDAVGRLAQLNRRMVEAGRSRVTTMLLPLDLDHAVRSAIQLVHNHPSVRDARLAVSVDGPLIVEAQHLLLSQIIINLVLNAAEATGGKGHVDVRAYARDGRAVLEVDDDGPGIPPERRDGLFDALETTKPDGNGMGLFSVKAAAKGLKGTVDIGTSPRGGARFSVTLPLAKSAATSAA